MKTYNACYRRAYRFVAWGKPDKYSKPQRKENCPPSLFRNKNRWKDLGKACNWNADFMAGALWAISNWDGEDITELQAAEAAEARGDTK